MPTPTLDDHTSISFCHPRRAASMQCKRGGPRPHAGHTYIYAEIMNVRNAGKCPTHATKIKELFCLLAERLGIVLEVLPLPQISCG